MVAKGTNNLEAYLKLLQGLEVFHNKSPGHLERTRALAREVIALDPDYMLKDMLSWHALSSGR